MMKEYTRKGIVLAGGSGTRLYPLTVAISKHFMPVYDKPMVYYPLSVLMLAGIREILIISTPGDLPLFKKLLGDGNAFGISLSYAEQDSPDGLAQAFTIAAETGFLQNEPVALILGDNIFHGQNLTQSLRSAMKRKEGATVFGHQVLNPNSYGVIEIGNHGQVISIEEKPEQPKSNYAVPGLYFYDDNVVLLAENLQRGPRGELEITDLNHLYLEQAKLHVELLGRGTTWFDAGTQDNLAKATEFVKIIESRQGLKIACLEEIAYRAGWLDMDSLKRYIKTLGRSPYTSYLKQLVEEPPDSDS